VALEITAVRDAHLLLDLPWSTPLEAWPADLLVALPRGISRHVVRFVRVGEEVYAVKEVPPALAVREYRLLRDLERLDVPAVEAVGVVDGRVDRDGEALEAALITRHLQFSLPYRAVFSQTLRSDTAVRLLDALAALLVQLHLTGLYWGDCSLSNVLFRRDAGAFAAYLVDAETGELHSDLTDGQRNLDIDTAQLSITGEMMDLAAGGLLDATIDPVQTGQDVARRYYRLWSELHDEQVLDFEERHRIAARIERLNELGFDVGELQIVTDMDGASVRIQPKVVDAGHHSRRLLRLTGLDVEENQARRLLNSLDAYVAETEQQDESEEIVAHQWLTEVFEPVVTQIPLSLRGKLEPAEVFHEVLEHRWFLSEAAHKDVGMQKALDSYLATVLTHRPDEAALLDSPEGGGGALGEVDEYGYPIEDDD
jgi:tRNA A-37 threonylcarbamoyl transferase component Bud32